MIRFPNCKINLGLHILERLPDGYHRLETVFYPLALSDILEINPSASRETQLTTTGIEVAGNNEDNLCFLAWRLLHEVYKIPAVDIHLHKIIPTGAGLGGGSADAGFTLSMLNELFELDVSKDKLLSLASKLGMDCSFFLMNSPALGTGKGEILSPISVELSGKHIVVVQPPVPVSTAEAYAGVKPAARNVSLAGIVNQPIDEWKHLLVNDFEESVFVKHPEIAKIKVKLYEKGAIYASMSGSGSTVYGIFNEKPDLSDSFDGNFVWQGLM